MGIKYIGKRISYLDEEDKLSIVILGKEEGNRPKLRLLWLFSWLIIGYIVSQEVQKLDAQDELRVVLFVFMAFWAYYLFRIVRALYWQWKGRESILLKKDKIAIKDAFGTLGRTYSYPLSNVNPMEHRLKAEGIYSLFEDSFWSIGLGELQYRIDGRTYLFGKRISEDEKKKVRDLFNKKLKAFKKDE